MTARKRREPPVNQYGLVKWSVRAFALVGVSFLVAGLWFRSSTASSPTKRVVSAAERELLATLADLRAAWEPRARARILRNAPAQAHRFAQPLQHVLQQPGHSLALPAVHYAAATGSGDLRDAVAGVVDDAAPPVRAAAVEAAETLGPWSPDELEQLLSAEHIVPVRLAALRVAAARTDGPWEAIVALLFSSNEGIRSAARQAIHADLPPEAARALWERVTTSTELEAEIALRALARARLASAYAKPVAQMLATASPRVQRAGLELLAAQGTPLDDAGSAVWELIQDTSVPAAVRSAGLYCLEQTGDCDAPRLRQAVVTMEPVMQYFAARCLIEAGDRHGTDVLLDLVDAESKRVAVASRQLLARLTGKSPGSTDEAFRSTLMARADIGADVALPPVDMNTW